MIELQPVESFCSQDRLPYEKISIFLTERSTSLLMDVMGKDILSGWSCPSARLLPQVKAKKF